MDLYAGAVALRDLLGEESRWTKKTLAVNKDGDAVEPNSKEACRWCVIGACGYLYDGDSCSDKPIRRIIKKVIDYDLITKWQDAPDRTHADIVKMLDKVVEIAKNEVG